MSGAATALVFGGFAVLLLAAVRWAIPSAAALSGVATIYWWFLIGGLGVFVPMLLLALLTLRGEALDGADIWRERLRFRPMTRDDWYWAIGALVVIGVMTAAIRWALIQTVGHADVTPAALRIPVDASRALVLASWLPFWMLNILGEEILWRGVVLPRQEAALGGNAWLANALGWTLFHLAFGAPMLVMLLPILFVLPFVTQRRKNSWVAVAIHAGLNGPGFVAVVFGLV